MDNRLHMQELLLDYMDEICSDEERDQVEEHLAVCPSCAAFVEETRALKAVVLAAYRPVEAPSGFEETVMKAVRQEPHAAPVTLRRYNWLFLPLVIPLLLGWIIVAAAGPFLSVSLQAAVNLTVAFQNVLTANGGIMGVMAVFALLLLVASGLSLRHLFRVKAV